MADGRCFLAKQDFSGKLAAIFILGLGIRLSIASLPNFSEDEAFSCFLSSLSLSRIFAYLPYDRHPPLHYALLHFIVQHAHSEIALRSLSVFSSLASIILVYKITRILVNDEAISLRASLFSAFFFGFWGLDTTARMFSLANVFQLAAAYFWLQILKEERPPLRTYALYALFMDLAMYTLYLSGVLALGHAVALLWLRPKKREAWITLGAALMLAAPEWLLFTGQTGNLIPSSVLTTKLYLAASYPYFLGIVPALQAKYHLPIQSVFYARLLTVLSVLCILPQCYGLRIFARKNKMPVVFLVAVCLSYFAPIGIAGLIFHAFSVVRMRYFLLIFPYLAMALSIALSVISAPFARRAVMLGLLAINGYLFFDYTMNSYLWGYDLKPFATTIQREFTKEDILVAYIPSTTFCLFNYYYDYPGTHFLFRKNDKNKAEMVFTHQGKFLELYIPEHEQTWKQWAQRLLVDEKRARVWLLMNEMPWYDGYPWVHDRQRDIRVFFQKNFDMEKSWKVTTALELNGEDTYFLFKLKLKSIRSARKMPL